MVREEDRFSNMQLWQLAEIGDIPINGVFEDKEGNQILWTGKSFQVHYSSASDKYVGMCLGDTWEYIGKKEDLE